MSSISINAVFMSAISSRSEGWQVRCKGCALIDCKGATQSGGIIQHANPHAKYKLIDMLFEVRQPLTENTRKQKCPLL